MLSKQKQIFSVIRDVVTYPQCQVAQNLEYQYQVASTYSEKDQMLIRNTRVLQHSGDVPSDSQVRQRRSDIKSSRKVKLRGNICMVWGFGLRKYLLWSFYLGYIFLHLKGHKKDYLARFKKIQDIGKLCGTARLGGFEIVKLK